MPYDSKYPGRKEKSMKKVNNYILLVDNYRRLSRQRNTAGRYRVGAKSEKEAIELLREKIGFGSIQVYYLSDDVKVRYKEVVKETHLKDRKTFEFEFAEPRHATAPQV